MSIAMLAQPIRAATAAAMLTSACSSGHYVTLPAPDLADFSDIDAVVVMSQHHSTLSPPGDVLRGKGAGAKKAMGDWAGDPFSGPPGYGGDPAAAVLLLGILIVGLPVAAAIGAASAHSGEEVDAAAESFRTAASDAALFDGLDSRVADRLNAIRPARWNCVEAASDDGTPPCARAARPATLIVGTAYSAAAKGRSSPDVTLIGKAEARLIRAGAEPVTVRWRYDSEPLSYFRLAKDDGARLRKAIGAMQDALAAAIVRDLFVEPKTERLRFSRKGQVRGGQNEEQTQVGARPTPPTSSIRRMTLSESFASGPSMDGQAIVTTQAERREGRGCVISAVDGSEPRSIEALPQLPDQMRAALVGPGAHRLSLSCPAEAEGERVSMELEIEVKAGKLYCTDGGVLTEASAPYRC